MTREEAVTTAAALMFEGEIVASFEGFEVIEVAGMFAVHDDFGDAPECPKVFGRFIDAYREAIRIADVAAMSVLRLCQAANMARARFSDLGA